MLANRPRVTRLDSLLDNPILRYQMLPRLLRRQGPRRSALLLGVGLLASGACGVAMTGLSPAVAYGLGLICATFWSFVTLLAPAAQMSRAIAQERQQGSWDALIVSRLKPAEIVFGKLLSALLPFWAIGLLLAPFLFVTGGNEYELFLPLGLVPRYLSTIGASASFASLGLWCSMRSKTETSAQFLTLMLLAMTYFLSLSVRVILGFGFAGLFEKDGFLVQAVVVAAPLAVLMLPGAFALADLVLRFSSLDRRIRG